MVSVHQAQQNAALQVPADLPQVQAQQAKTEKPFEAVMMPDSVRLNKKTVLNDSTHLIKLAPDYQSRLGLKVAVESTRNNGIDEIFLARNNESYMLVGDNLALDNIKKGDDLELNGDAYQVLDVSDEANSATQRFQSVAGEALSAGLSNGVGGAAAGLTVIFMEKQILKMGGKVGGKWGLALGAVVGFASGFAWGAGGSLTRSMQEAPSSNWASLHDLADPNFKSP